MNAIMLRSLVQEPGFAERSGVGNPHERIITGTTAHRPAKPGSYDTPGTDP